MIYHLIVGVVAFVLLVSVWMVILHFARQRLPEKYGDDVLACGLCGVGGACHCGLRRRTPETAGVGPNENRE